MKDEHGYNVIYMLKYSTKEVPLNNINATHSLGTMLFLIVIIKEVKNKCLITVILFSNIGYSVEHSFVVIVHKKDVQANQRSL